MYVPASFSVTDPHKIAQFIRQHSFGTLVTLDRGVPEATHLPLLYRAESTPTTLSINPVQLSPEPNRAADLGTVWGHMARANEQWRHLQQDRETLIIFQGPHAYVSPTWYETQPAVPTWNYTAVHLYGWPQIVEDRTTVIQLLADLTSTYESSLPQPWNQELPAEYRDKMLAGLVAFRLEVTRMEAKFKLGQNRSSVDQQRVATALSQSRYRGDQELAQLMADEGLASIDACLDRSGE